MSRLKCKTIFVEKTHQIISVFLNNVSSLLDKQDIMFALLETVAIGYLILFHSVRELKRWHGIIQGSDWLCLLKVEMTCTGD